MDDAYPAIPISEPRLERAQRCSWWTGYAWGLGCGLVLTLLFFGGIRVGEQYDPPGVGARQPTTWESFWEHRRRLVIIVPTCEECQWL